MDEDVSKKLKGQLTKLKGHLKLTYSKTSGVVVDSARKSSEVSKQFAQCAIDTTKEAFGKAQAKLGEDYYAILEQNPLILDTLSRSNLLIDNSELLSTAFNIPWTNTLLWGAAASGAISFQDQISRVVGEYIHGKGHIARWQEISAFMDTAKGRGHRLKFGHSIDYLPQIIEKFGLEGVPAFFMHLLQDSTTVHGIPTVPQGWELNQVLQSANVPPKIATGLVSINFASLLGAIGVITCI